MTHQSRKAIVVAWLLCCTALFGAPSFAGTPCSGDPGYVLTIPSQIEIGSSLVVGFQAPTGGDLFLIVSKGPGPTDTPLGQFCVDFPPVYIFHVVLPDSGKLSLIRELPCDPGLVGVTGYFQFIAFSNVSSDHGISNQSTMTLATGPCDDLFCSYTQGGWGGQCQGGNAGCIRDANFATVFPNGLLMGDQDGLDGDALFAVLLTSASAVEDFLPQGGTSGTFDQDLTDPLSTTAGVFAGQLAAAKLSVGFDDAGVFDSMKNGNLIHLGDAVFNGCVDDGLVGLTVRQVIAIADRMISGEFGSCDPSITPGCQSVDIYDSNNDGTPDVSIDDVMTALQLVNTTFDQCQPITDCLTFP